MINNTNTTHVDLEGRVCTSCKEYKLWSFFYKAKQAKTGHQAKCKACFDAKHNSRDAILRRTYGIGALEYDRLLRLQGGACAVCGQPQSSRALAVDHCHDTGKIRGLLCINCNLGLGCYMDNPALLEQAADYLREHR